MGASPARRITRLAAAALVAAACGLASGCVDVTATGPLAAPNVDMTSPVARQVEQASAVKGRFPRFKDIPPVPEDVRPTRAWTRSIYDTVRLRRQLLVQAAVAGPRPNDTAQFAQDAKAYATPQASAPGASATPDKQTNAFVEGARERAKTPSPAR